MIMWKIVLTRRASKDIELLKRAGLSLVASRILDIISKNPFMTPPPYEKLIGALNGYYSRRINFQHRIIYKIDESNKVVTIMRMWTHYDI